MSPPSPTPTLQQEAAYDPHYDDPTADVIFRSTSGTLFRVSSWHLAKHRWVASTEHLIVRVDGSTFFAGLRERASPSTTTAPIPSGLNDQSMRYILARFCSAPAALASAIHLIPSIPSAFAILGFLEKFGFDDTKTAVNKAIEEAAVKDPWGYFRGASTVDCVSTAQLALKHMTREHLGHANFWLWVHQIPRDWRLAFLVAVFDTGNPQIKKTATTISLQANPAGLSTRFASELAKLRPKAAEKKAIDAILKGGQRKAGAIASAGGSGKCTVKRKAEDEGLATDVTKKSRLGA